MYFQKEIETLSSPQLKKLQEERLINLVDFCYKKQPFYKESMDKINLKPKDIKGIEDIKKLPFTTKTHLRDHYPFGLLTMPVNQLAEIHASSGTTGKPTVVAYAQEDLQVWSDVMSRAMVCAGAKRGFSA